MATDERERDAVDPGGHAPDSERRRFLARITIGLGTFAALVAVIPAVGVVLWPVRRREPEVWRAVGRVEDFPVGGTRKVSFIDPSPVPWAGFAAMSAAWLPPRGRGGVRGVLDLLYAHGLPGALGRPLRAVPLPLPRRRILRRWLRRRRPAAMATGPTPGAHPGRPGGAQDARRADVRRVGEVPGERRPAGSIADAFVVRSDRSVAHDVEFGVRQIVDVARKALSPGIDDATTAVNCVDHPSAVLSRLAVRGLHAQPASPAGAEAARRADPRSGRTEDPGAVRSA